MSNNSNNNGEGMAAGIAIYAFVGVFMLSALAALVLTVVCAVAAIGGIRIGSFHFRAKDARLLLIVGLAGAAVAALGVAIFSFAAQAMAPWYGWAFFVGCGYMSPFFLVMSEMDFGADEAEPQVEIYPPAPRAVPQARSQFDFASWNDGER